MGFELQISGMSRYAPNTLLDQIYSNSLNTPLPPSPQKKNQKKTKKKTKQKQKQTKLKTKKAGQKKKKKKKKTFKKKKNPNKPNPTYHVVFSKVGKIEFWCGNLIGGQI